MINSNKFPIEVLPSKMRAMINNIKGQSTTSINTIAANMLSIVGYSMLHRWELPVNVNWINRPNLWVLTLGASGNGKTPVFNGLTKYIVEYDGLLVSNYENQITMINKYHKALKYELKGETDADILNQWCKTNLKYYDTFQCEFIAPEGMPEEPQKINAYMEKFTFEAFYNILSTKQNNNRGVLIRQDEIMGLFNSLNQYRKGSDEQDLIKAWEYGGVKVNRSNSENSLIIKQQNISLFGTTQIKNIYDIVTDSRKDSGLIYRLLVSIDREVDDSNIYEKIFDSEIVDVYKEYNYMIKYFMTGYNLEVDRKQLILTNDCKVFLKKWKGNIKKRKVTSIDSITYGEIINKIDYYIHRIAIIINRVYAYENSKTHSDLNMYVRDYEAAAKICDYFINNMVDLLNLTEDDTDRHFKTEDEKDFFSNLPESFKREQLLSDSKEHLNKESASTDRMISRWKKHNLINKSKNIYSKAI